MSEATPQPEPTRWDGMSREELERPVSQGGMSMGEGRRLEPTLVQDSELFGPCAASPDGMHHYTAVSCIQSVEHFVCDHCRNGWYD